MRAEKLARLKQEKKDRTISPELIEKAHRILKGHQLPNIIHEVQNKYKAKDSL